MTELSAYWFAAAAAGQREESGETALPPAETPAQSGNGPLQPGSEPQQGGEEERQTPSGQNGDAQEETPPPVNPEQTRPGEQSGTEGGEEQTMQETLLTTPSQPVEREIGPLPLFGYLLAAALACGLAALLYQQRRRKNMWKIRTGKRPGSQIGTAYVHELGARDSQQDAFCIAGQEAPECGVLAAVADGMGGLVNSGQVSAALTDTLRDAYAPTEELPPVRQLQLLLRQAVDRVEELRKESTAQSGSTLAACLIKSGALSWISVGDSRIYLWRGGGLIQLSRDHDFSHDLTLMALQGELELAEADRDPRRESLTSYIGRGFPRKVDWNPEPVPLVRGDRVLLVSDGVYRALSQQEMADCLALEPQSAAGALRAAIQRKALAEQDNYTAVILSIK